ncbi:MAG: hypothetical protein ACK58X_03360 [Planctomycetota bacterium]
MNDGQRVCFFGSPAMGSWKVRAQQVATARPTWRATGNLEPADVVANDVFVAVKRPYRHRLRLLAARGRTTVYDVVDCWVQPDDGLLHPDLPSIRRFFERHFAGLAVDGVIFPNRAMCDDLGDLVPNPTWIPHHYWPGMAPIEVRERAAVVGYEGAASYLGPWRREVERACRRLGLRFVVNPPSLRDVDIGFAVRGGVHASLMAQRYKSNVKLANFYGAGIPCLVGADEVSYRETDNGEVRFFATPQELVARLDELRSFATRQRVHRSFLAVRGPYSLAAIADRYEAYLRQIAARRAA